MALISFVSHDLSGTSFFEAFCCCSTCFNLRHFYFLLDSWFCFIFHITAVSVTGHGNSNCLTFFAEKHCHASSLDLGSFFHYSDIFQKLRKIIQHVSAACHMSHFSSTETQSDFYAVTFCKEFPCSVYLCL